MNLKTANGVLIVPGMIVWVYPSDNVLGGEIEEMQVVVNQDDVGNEHIVTLENHWHNRSYRRNNCIYSSYAEAELARLRHVKPIPIDLDTEDYHQILLGLSLRIRDETVTVNLLRTARDRELTYLEKTMLPASLRFQTRGDLISEFNHWDCGLDSLKHLFEKLAAHCKDME